MFKYNLPKVETFQKAKLSNAAQLIQKYWMKTLLLFLAVYILTEKDINLQLSMNSAQQVYQQPSGKNAVNPKPVKLNTVPTKMEKEELPKSDASQFSIMDYLPNFYKPTKEKTNPKKTAKPKDNKANNFRNLTFILSPSYAKRHNVDRAIVKEKVGKCVDYVKRFAPIAISEMNKYGVPASITLAQGLLESDAGESRLALKNNNHFGIKCFSKKCKKNHCANFTDDTHKDFFRKYSNVWESYRAHSVFLQNKRYKPLQKHGTKDYHAWAHGLSKAGYATDKKYAEKLIKIIEVMKLHKYDE